MAARAAIAERLPIVFGLPEPEAAAACGVSVSFFRQLVEEGRMPQPRLINSRRVYDVDEVRAAFKDFPHHGQAASSKWAAVR